MFHPLCLPQQDAAHDEGMPQVMDARGMVSAPVAPAQPFSQFGEDAMYLPVAQRRSPSATSRADEEGGLVPCR